MPHKAQYILHKIMDYTLKTHRHLLTGLKNAGYRFIHLGKYLESSARKMVILRHDVDAKPGSAIRMAAIESEYGVYSSYYFRARKGNFERNVIFEIAKDGHEIGYHYEDLATCNGDHKAAIKSFERNLKALRKIAPVSTICMHGSPLARYDNRDLWKHYDYRDFGIIAEPYFDIDFSKVLYLTDTGRRWDGHRFAVRDTVSGEHNHKAGTAPRAPVCRTTFDIIRALEANQLPDQIMLTFHPQRWTNNPLLWTQELILQNVKNVAKLALKKVRRGSR
ncbi:MAG: hypothetical protein GF344_04190 [Chitinivibrionales bacterium]|nr:hypothetical protein [Chitinivibrionales bacterium]